MDAEKQADLIVARLRGETRQRPYALGVLFLLGLVLATAGMFY